MARRETKRQMNPSQLRMIKLSEATVLRLRTAYGEVQKATQTYQAVLAIALEAMGETGQVRNIDLQKGLVELVSSSPLHEVEAPSA